MPKVEEKTRKTRSDKKVEFAPTFLAQDYETIAHLVHVHDRDMKPFLEDIVKVALYAREVFEFFNPYFRRDLSVEFGESAAVYLGDPQRKRSRPRRAQPGEFSTRIHVKFDKMDADRIDDFAYALDCTPSGAINLLVWKALRSEGVMERVLNGKSRKNGRTNAHELKQATERRLAALAEANRPAKKRVRR